MTSLEQNLTHLTGGRLDQEELQDLVGYVVSLEAGARRQGRMQLATLARQHQERADYFKPDLLVTGVDSLEWAASLEEKNHGKNNPTNK